MNKTKSATPTKKAKYRQTAQGLDPHDMGDYLDELEIVDLASIKGEPNLSEDKEKGKGMSYKALWAIKGIAKGKRTDISSRIDEILYGKNGVWRGRKK